MSAWKSLTAVLHAKEKAPGGRIQRFPLGRDILWKKKTVRDALFGQRSLAEDSWVGGWVTNFPEHILVLLTFILKST